MGSFLDAYEGVTRLEVDPERGYWIDLWDHASEEALEEAERAIANMRIVNGQTVPDMDVVRYRHLAVLAHLKEWNLDDDGVPWPYTLASLKRLPARVFNELWQVVENLDAPMTPAERKRFPSGGGGVAESRNGRATKPRKVQVRDAAGAAAAHELG